MSLLICSPGALNESKMFDMYAKELSTRQKDDGKNEQTDDRFYQADSTLAGC
jgi:hypothetical protein